MDKQEKPVELRFREIHLDFHTSGMIEGIGAEFDPEEYAATLEKARVDSVTTFARGHHGWIYFDSKKFPERVHPHLKRNLLKEQIDACHARNIRVPIYVTIQWDEYTAQQHPEWRIMRADGCLEGFKPFEAGFYKPLCLNSPYVDFLKEHVQEILETLPTDGFFFDIVHPHPCVCKYCMAGMKEQGLNPADEADRKKYGVQVLHTFERDFTAFVRKFNKDCTIFYNAGHVGPGHREMKDAYTHWELESLPSGGWGYLHFPVAMHYARTLGLDCMGMTGKFHTSWGDFHSFKNPEALQFECFNMLALNAKCSIGDQLPPNGKICQTTYNLIGSVYSEVEKKEPWCKAARPLVDIGVLTPEEFTGGSHVTMPPAIQGATRMLQEGRQQFDIIDTKADFEDYRVLILADDIPFSAPLADKMRKYLQQGGSILASYKSGLKEGATDFALDEFGVTLLGEAPFSPDFIVPKGTVGDGLAETEHVMYMQGLEVEPKQGAEVLSDVKVPYFNRTWEHYCSHAHTPSSGKIGYAGIIKKGNVIYMMHPIFAQYNKRAPLWCKKLVLNALSMLLPDPLVTVKGPSTLLTALNDQPQQNRQVLHLLHYIPERRAVEFDIVEDIIPLYHLEVSVKADSKVKSVVVVPEQVPLEFEQKEGRVNFVLPKLEGHQMIELNKA